MRAFLRKRYRSQGLARSSRDAALRSCQKDLGLEVDGSCGPATLPALADREGSFLAYDPAETRSYFEEEERKLCDERRGTGDVIPPADPSFPQLAIPQSSGAAMGLDRLLAAHLGLNCIAPLLLFPLSDMLTSGKPKESE